MASGQAHVVVSDMVFSNGFVVLPGPRTLMVAETWAARLTASDLGEQGEPRDKRLRAPLPQGSSTPDGRCAEGEGGVRVWSVATGLFPPISPAAHGDRGAAGPERGRSSGPSLPVPAHRPRSSTHLPIRARLLGQTRRPKEKTHA